MNKQLEEIITEYTYKELSKALEELIQESKVADSKTIGFIKSE